MSPGLGQQAQQFGEAGGVVVDTSARHHTSISIDDDDVVVFCGPIYSAVQVQDFTPSIGVPAVAGGFTRRPNRGTRRSVISLAVRDSSTPQDLVLSIELEAREYPSGGPSCGRLGQRHPTTTPRGLPPGAPFFQKSSNDGNTRHHLGGRPDQEQRPVNSTRNQSLLND